MDKDLIKTIKKEMQKFPLVCGYLFGSRATGKVGALSDYDFAIFFDEKKVSSNQFLKTKLKIIQQLKLIVKNDKIDFVILNEANPVLAMNIISSGKLIFCRSNIFRINLEAEIMNQYLDRVYYEKRHNILMRRQILEGAI